MLLWPRASKMFKMAKKMIFFACPPSIEGPTDRRERFLCSGGWSSASLVLLFIWHTQLGEIYRLAP